MRGILKNNVGVLKIIQMNRRINLWYEQQRRASTADSHSEKIPQNIGFIGLGIRIHIYIYLYISMYI
jgi:hypothetical protein